MKYFVYSIRDVKTGFLTPTVDVNDPSAARNFEHAVMNSLYLFHSHSADYSLYRIGTFDSETGKIEACLPEHVIDAESVKK